jgi:DNA-binding GntR family transcriptional regulator
MSLSELGDSQLFQTRRFSDIACELIRERILSGSLSPGSRLNEVALSDELRISRPPLREALRILSGEGLVEFIPGKGAAVTDLDLASFIQVAEIRMALEVATARLAAERATPEDVVVLTAAMNAQEAELGTPGSPYPHHIVFHHELAAATHNPRLESSLVEIIRQGRLASMKTNENPQRAQQVFAEHRAIAEAVVSGDANRAEHAMRQHIEANTSATVVLLSALEKKGEDR